MMTAKDRISGSSINYRSSISCKGQELAAPDSAVIITRVMIEYPVIQLIGCCQSLFILLARHSLASDSVYNQMLV